VVLQFVKVGYLLHRFFQLLFQLVHIVFVHTKVLARPRSVASGLVGLAGGILEISVLQYARQRSADLANPVLAGFLLRRKKIPAKMFYYVLPVMISAPSFQN